MATLNKALLAQVKNFADGIQSGSEAVLKSRESALNAGAIVMLEARKDDTTAKDVIDTFTAAVLTRLGYSNRGNAASSYKSGKSRFTAIVLASPHRKAILAAVRGLVKEHPARFQTQRAIEMACRYVKGETTKSVLGKLEFTDSKVTEAGIRADLMARTKGKPAGEKRDSRPLAALHAAVAYFDSSTNFQTLIDAGVMSTKMVEAVKLLQKEITAARIKRQDDVSWTR